MAGNNRPELTSTSPDSGFAANHFNRGGYSGLNLDRRGSFRETCDGRMLNSGKSSSRGSNTPAGDVSNLSQCLGLEPIVMNDQRYTRSVEIRRVLGVSAGSSSEENSFGSAHLRNSSPVAIEELKRFRASVAETRIRASGRVKKWSEHLQRLNNYYEARSSKKQQQSDTLTKERPVVTNMKMGNQINRSPSDLGDNKLEERPKNTSLNKRIRSSVAETRAEGRNSGLKKQPLMIPKDRETTSADSEVGLDKNRRLPAGGESWDKKMKRKRSLGAVCPRPFDNEGEAKRTMLHKHPVEPNLQSSDSHPFRPGPTDLCGRFSKIDGTSPLASPGSRTTVKLEPDRATLSGEKARFFHKGNIKSSNHEENDTEYVTPAITKGKVSRAPRSSSNVAMGSIPNVTRVTGSTLESSEVPQNMQKSVSINGANNRKRATIPGSPSSSPITQWVGQRPQKSSRTRRSNLVSPVSNHSEVHTPVEGFSSPSDSGARLQSSGNTNSLLSKGFPNGFQNTKANSKSSLSPARLSDSEESTPGENRLQSKMIGSNDSGEKVVIATQSVGTSGMITKTTKFLGKEENSDGGMRRQGRSERDSVLTPNISPAREKSENAAIMTKSLQSVSHGFDKNGSKLGRPGRKLSDRKGFARVVHLTGAPPDFSGDVEDDREELLAAANLAYNHSSVTSEKGLWKHANTFFSNISSEKKSYLMQQLKITVDSEQSLSQTLGYCNNNNTNIQADYMHEDVSLSDTLSEERSRSAQSKSESKDMTSPVESVDQGKRSSSLAELGSGRKFESVPSLYQRVLSALIVGDDTEDYDQNGWNGCVLPYGAAGAALDSPDEGREFECEYTGVHTLNNGFVNGRLSCYENGPLGKGYGFQDLSCNGDIPARENGSLNSEVQVLVGLSSCDSDGAQSHGSSSIDCPYEQLPIDAKLLLELHSIGLFPETLPDLHGKEDETITEEIIQLKRGLHQQVGKKKAYLGNLHEALQQWKDIDGRDLEHVAMDKLVEMSHKKLLSTRGTRGSKYGIAKVSKQVALGFTKRTLDRCKKFEDSGVGCFSEPALRDIIFAPPPPIQAQTLTGEGLGIFINTGNNGNGGTSRQSDQTFAKNGPILNRGKKKEVFLDDVGGVSYRTPPLDTSLLGGGGGGGGMKWKRTETTGNSKTGRASLGNTRGERKPKTKSKQRTGQLSTTTTTNTTAGYGIMINSNNNKFSTTTTSNVGGVGAGSSSGGGSGGGGGGRGPDKDVIIKGGDVVSSSVLNEIGTMEDLDVGVEEIGGAQDLNSWFNEVDGIQDHEQAEGLSIPMDDISMLFF